MISEQKIAIPSLAPGGLKAEVTTRFGRCPFFTVIYLKNGEIEEVNVVKNQATDAMGGAGPMAAQFIAEMGVNVVIGANYGPNAASALTQGNIQMYGPHQGTVQEVLDTYLAGDLSQIKGANVGSHTGMGGGRGMGRGGGRGMGRGGGRGGGRGNF